MNIHLNIQMNINRPSETWPTFKKRHNPQNYPGGANHLPEITDLWHVERTMAWQLDSINPIG